MAEQLILNLPIDTAFGRDDFFVSGANRAAVDTLSDWSAWPNGRALLSGEPGAGKTHLARIWCEAAGGRIAALDGISQVAEDPQPLCIEDLHTALQSAEAQRALFHIINLSMEKGFALLLTGQGTPRDWNIALPDLHSRLQATHLISLGPPDDQLLAAVLVKQMTDRQLRVEPDLIPFLLARMERSYFGAKMLVEQLDTAALQRKRPLTKRFAAQILDAAQWNTL